jgi:hypothetical protein
MKSESQLISLAADLLSKDLQPTGIYGKITTASKLNDKKKNVSFHIKRNSDAIYKLIFEDRNVYLENDKHDQSKLLNQFLDSFFGSIDIETYKMMKDKIGLFINSR